jgi:hypothetical protein
MDLSFRSLRHDATWAVATTVLGLCLLGGPASAGTSPRPTPSATPSASLGTVTITDGSHVLSPADLAALRADASDIGPAASGPEPVRIYTSATPGQDDTTFDQHYKAMLSSAPANVIIIAVNTASHHVIITSGAYSGLSNAGADKARADFTDSYHADPSYKKALSAALLTIEVFVLAGPSAALPTPADSGGGIGTVPVAIVVIGLIIVIAVVAGRRGRKTAGHHSTGRRYPHHHGSTYQDSGASFDAGSGAAHGSGGHDHSGGGTSSGHF